MKLIKSLILLVFLSVFFFSCKDKLELNAPYKEIPSIYAIMNPQNKIQVIRINKVFLGESDANQMAQIADSINYPDQELEVTMTREEYGAPVVASRDNKMTIVFHDSVIQAQPGSFSRTQRVYVTSDRLWVTGKYKLKVRNKKTGNVFTAAANAIDSVSGKQSNPPVRPPYYPYAPTNTNAAEFINFKPGGSVDFLPNENVYGKYYNLVIRMHFFDSLYSGAKNWRFVDYAFGNKSVNDAIKVPFPILKHGFTTAEFFSSMGVGLSKLNLPVDVALRKMDRVEFIISTSTQDYIDYMQYVAPSLSISQNKPLYSNFDGQTALGLFTFRTRCSVSKQLANDFITEFAYNPFTCQYGFATSANTKPGCQ